MRVPRYLYIIVLFLFYGQNQSFGQLSKGVLIDSTLLLKAGIYTSVDEFLNNSPSYPVDFKVISEKADYIISRKEQDNYFLDFYTSYGVQRIIPLEEIWGFCDGYSIFLNNNGRPYQLMYLGQISLLRFVKIYHKNQTAKDLSILLLGNSVKNVLEIDVSFYLLKEDMIVPYNQKEFNNILEQDLDIYYLYELEKYKDRWTKRFWYIYEFNMKHPLIIEEAGIIIE